MAKRALNAAALDAFAGIAAALASCGGVDDSEVAAFLLAAEDLGCDGAQAEAAIGRHLEALGSGSDAAVDKLLRDSCEAVPSAQRNLAMELAVHVVMADGDLSAVEVWRLTATRVLLGVSEEMLIMMVAHEVSNADGFVVSAAKAVDLLK